MALIPIGAGAASEHPVELIARCSSIHVDGEMLGTSPSTHAIYLPQGEGDYSWSLSAQTIVVNWTKETYLETGKPFSPDEVLILHRQGMESDEVTIANGRARSTRLDENSGVIINHARPTRQVDAESQGFMVRPMLGSTMSLIADLPSLSVDVPVGAGLAEAVLGRGVLKSGGTFSVYLWNAEVMVTSSQGTDRYVSGNWTEPVGPSTQGHPARARHHHYQSLRLDVTGGELVVRLNGRPASWIASSVVVSGNMAVGLEDRQPASEDSGDEVFANVSQLVARNETSAEPRLRVAISVPQEAFPGSGPALPTGGPEANGNLLAESGKARQGMALPSGILAAVALVTGIGFVSKRRGEAGTEVAEGWLLAGRPRSAALAARRILRRDGADAEAAFILAVSLLAQGKHAQLVRDVEPIALRMPLGSRRSVAFLLALAASEVGQHERAARWAQEASEDPLLRGQLEARRILVPDASESRAAGVPYIA